ncbi:hypothetical protein J437_LFUL016184 [Ladona fulva]|uniref:Uncharacterized protein n=1 Tax=Ladona fulva TaxID=123851 RepID=A0A8K0PB57_LADFU|nr:hypothetical protein J437_LFUL016184 [Ladona fulva]
MMHSKSSRFLACQIQFDLPVSLFDKDRWNSAFDNCKALEGPGLGSFYSSLSDAGACDVGGDNVDPPLNFEGVFLALICLPRSPPALTNRQWEILEDCIPLLNPLEELNTELSGDKYVTSSVIIPLIMGAQHLVMNSKHTTTVGKRLKEVLLENFSKRLSPYEKQVVPSSDTILDPRFKKMAFGLEENASEAYNRIQDEADALHLREYVGVSMSEEEIPTSTKPQGYVVWGIQGLTEMYASGEVGIKSLINAKMQHMDKYPCPSLTGSC